MKRRYRFTDTTTGALWYLLLVVVLPVTTLVIAGLVALWQQGQLLVVLLTWLALTLIAYGVFVNWPKKRARQRADNDNTLPDANAEAIDELPDQLSPRDDWVTRDIDIWQRSCLSIEETLTARPHWNDLPAVALQQLSLIAEQYHGAQKQSRFRFTLPEALLVISVASDRYRTLVMDYLPFADRISVATLVSLMERKEQIERGVTWFNRARRTLRLTNPLAAAIGEVRDQFTNRVFDSASDALQVDLKRLLLQEIAQVGIDLYSGRLRVSDVELEAYRSAAAVADETRTAEAAEPLRVVLLGQVSAGKSSLVNALITTLAAETDQLPTTDRTTMHALHSEQSGTVHLLDTPGIDDSADRDAELLETIVAADLVLHVCRATQPARAPDQRLQTQMTEYFLAHPARRAPPVILVMTHVDQLSPKNEWEPPYDLDSHELKAQNMLRALESVRSQIGYDDTVPALPVCLSATRTHWNIEALTQQMTLASDSAVLAQLNRRRVERGDASVGVSDRIRQAGRLGLALGKRVLNRS